MGLWLGDGNCKEWCDLLDEIKDFSDTQDMAEFLTSCVVDGKTNMYIIWLARCALHLNAKVKELEKS